MKNVLPFGYFEPLLFCRGYLWLFLLLRPSVLKIAPWNLWSYTEIPKTKARLSDKSCAWSSFKIPFETN